MSAGSNNKQNSYTLPTDAVEANRLDFQHELFRLTFQGKLIFAPIGSQPTSILDIGCGTSTWAIEIASQFPNTKVYGLDLGQPQPSTVPSNYTYITGDFEKPWPFEDAQFDYIHGRFINIGMARHKFVISEARRCLKLNGWFEMQEMALPGPRSMGSVTAYWDLYVEAAANMGRDLQAPRKWGNWLTDAEFQNVRQEEFEWPIGRRGGETDERMIRIGDMMMINYTGGLRGFSMGFLTRGAGWGEERVDELLVGVGKDLKENPGENAMPIYVIWGQKPA